MIGPMKIDIFNHFFPKRFFDEFINTPAGPKTSVSAFGKPPLSWTWMPAFA